MNNLGDIRLFVEAASLGGLSAAGRKLGLSPAAASARLIWRAGRQRDQLKELNLCIEELEQTPHTK